MIKKTKIWLIIAASFISVGCLLFGGVMTVLGWDFQKLSTVQYGNKEYILQEHFENIEIISTTADIVLLSSPDGSSKVYCHEQKNLYHNVTVIDGKLRIEINDTRKWYEHIGINFKTAKIQVFLPKSIYGTLSVSSNTGDVEIGKNLQFTTMEVTNATGHIRCYASATGDVKLKTGTGDILADAICATSVDFSVTTGNVTAKNFTCSGNVSISVSTGKVSLTDVTCKNFLSNGSTGNISMHHVVALENYRVERTTGDVILESCDAANLYITTTTGDIQGSLLTDKVFLAKTTTGDVDVPKTVTGGACELQTTTGKIQIKIG